MILSRHVSDVLQQSFHEHCHHRSYGLSCRQGELVLPFFAGWRRESCADAAGSAPTGSVGHSGGAGHGAQPAGAGAGGRERIHRARAHRTLRIGCSSVEPCRGCQRTVCYFHHLQSYPSTLVSDEQLNGSMFGMCAAESSGLRLAVMTTLMRLLEVKLAELEGAGGTGPLEEDVRLLEGPLSTPGKLF